MADWQHFGGAPPSSWHSAPTLKDVVERVRGLIDGKVVVGHGVAKDLLTLGIRIPQDQQRSAFAQLHRECARHHLQRDLMMRTLFAFVFGGKISLC